MNTPNTVEINPQTDPEFSVIWLHGLGADGHDFEPIVPALNLKKPTRFIFPHAPIRSITINNHMQMRAWYDIIALSLDAGEDEKGIRESEAIIIQLIEEEHKKGISYERIVLAGFSQGGAMVLFTGLRFPHTLAGIIALSCYLPLYQSLPLEANANNKDIPIFMAHGQFDMLLPITLGQITKKFLTQQNYKLQWQTYPMQHGVCPEEITAVGEWINKLC